MNEKIIEGAFQTIIEYCQSKPSCTGCRFDVNGQCFFLICNLPCDWDGDFSG